MLLAVKPKSRLNAALTDKQGICMKTLYLVSTVFCLSLSLCFALCLTAAVDNRVNNYFAVKQKFSGLRSATDICDFHSRLRKDTVKA